jgi:hypothetical protein
MSSISCPFLRNLSSKTLYFAAGSAVDRIGFGKEYAQGAREDMNIFGNSQSASFETKVQEAQATSA